MGEPWNVVVGDAAPKGAPKPGRFGVGQLTQGYSLANASVVTRENVRFENFPQDRNQKIWLAWAWAEFLHITQVAARDDKAVERDDWFNITEAPHLEPTLTNNLNVMSQAVRNLPITLVYRDIAEHEVYRAQHVEEWEHLQTGEDRARIAHAGPQPVFLKTKIHAMGLVFAASRAVPKAPQQGMPLVLEPHTPRNGSGIRIQLFRDCGVDAQDQHIFIHTLYHELSHAVLGTDDHEFRGSECYGVEQCQEVALYDPMLALWNADNYGLYAKSLAVIGRLPRSEPMAAMRQARDAPRTAIRPTFEERKMALVSAFQTKFKLGWAQPEDEDMMKIEEEAGEQCDPTTVPAEVSARILAKQKTKRRPT